MAERTLKTRIRLKRDTEANFESVQNTFIPLSGEVCFVETISGLQAKVGDGVSTFGELNYVNQGILDALTNLSNTKQDKIISNYNLMYGITFIGTGEEYKTANAAGEIPEGAIIVITDGDLPTTDETSAVLGTAILGTMILG